MVNAQRGRRVKPYEMFMQKHTGHFRMSTSGFASALNGNNNRLKAQK